jgi:hypothetical protein
MLKKDLYTIDEAPDREWRIITDLVENNREPGRRSEQALRRNAYHFLRRWIKSSVCEADKLKKEHPDIYVAACLNQNPLSVKWIIEAGLLTDVSFEELGKYVGKPVSVIKVYEKLFFDVRGRLDSKGQILNSVLLPTIVSGFDGRDFDFLYKTIAYCAGWKAFQAFVEVGEMDPNTESWLASSFRSRLNKIGWLAVHRIEVNQFTAIEIIDKCLELKRVEQERGLGAAQDQAAQLMKDLLTGTSLTIISSKEKLLADEPRATSSRLDTYSGSLALPKEILDGKD